MSKNEPKRSLLSKGLTMPVKKNENTAKGPHVRSGRVADTPKGTVKTKTFG